VVEPEGCGDPTLLRALWDLKWREMMNDMLTIDPKFGFTFPILHIYIYLPCTPEARELPATQVHDQPATSSGPWIGRSDLSIAIYVSNVRFGVV